MASVLQHTASALQPFVRIVAVRRGVLRTSSFSTQSKASAAVHGEIDASQVRSKAMRSKLAAAGRDRENAVARAADPEQQEQLQPQAPPQQEAGPQPTFSGVMGGNMLQGFAISLGFMLVFGLARAVGMEGERTVGMEGERTGEEEVGEA